MLAPRHELWSTPEPALRAMLRMAGVGPGDVLLDIGCGDGRTLALATELGARAIGIEVEARRARQARRRVDGLGPERAGLVRVQCRNAMNLTPAEAVQSGVSVVALYLIPRGYKAVLPLLQGIAAARRRAGEERPLRVVTYVSGLPGVPAVAPGEVHDPEQPDSGYSVQLFALGGGQDDDLAYEKWYAECVTGGAGDCGGEDLPSIYDP